MDYLQQILTARVYDVAQETALDEAPNLSKRLNNRLLLKREDMQSVFSFKLRGAYNKMVKLSPEVLAISFGKRAKAHLIQQMRSLSKTHQIIWEHWLLSGIAIASLQTWEDDWWGDLPFATIIKSKPDGVPW